MLKIKVCGMTQAVQIAALSKTAADFIGFIFYKKSKRYVATEIEVADVKQQTVGVFVDASIAEIELELKKVKGISILQLHGKETVEQCAELRKRYKIIKAFGVNQQTNINAITEPYLNDVDYFLFDTQTDQHGGSGRKFDWKVLEKYTWGKPFFLSGGIGIEDVEYIKQLKIDWLFAIDINSRFEVAPGVKDINTLERFINSLKNDNL